MTRFNIYYQSRELARELGDLCLGSVTPDTTEEAVRIAGRDPEIIRRAMPCASLWAVRMRDEQQEGLAR